MRSNSTGAKRFTFSTFRTISSLDVLNSPNPTRRRRFTSTSNFPNRAIVCETIRSRVFRLREIAGKASAWPGRFQFTHWFGEVIKRRGEGEKCARVGRVAPRRGDQYPREALSSARSARTSLRMLPFIDTITTRLSCIRSL